MQESGDTITIGDVKVAPGEIKHIKLKISESFFTSPIVMPVSVINGLGDGPRLLLSAATHGDEVNGVGIVRELIYSINHTNFNGMLICVPVMNITGFLNHTRYLPDGRDLNRNFPGRADGNPAQRIAHTIFTEVVSKCDFALDFHTAGDGRANMIQVRADMRDSNVKRIAKAFGSEIIIDSEGLPGTLRRSAAQSGIPTITIEAGEPHKFERKVVKQCLQGIMNVIYELGMMKGTICEPRFQVVVKKTEWVRADRGGILEMKTYPRSLEKEGNELCVITNPFGVEVGIVRAPFTGMVVGVTTRPVASPGSPICHMVKIDKTLYKVEQAIRKKAEEVEKVHGLTELLQEIKSEDDIAEIELQLQKVAAMLIAEREEAEKEAKKKEMNKVETQKLAEEKMDKESKPEKESKKVAEEKMDKESKPEKESKKVAEEKMDKESKPEKESKKVAEEKMDKESKPEKESKKVAEEKMDKESKPERESKKVAEEKMDKESKPERESKKVAEEKMDKESKPEKEIKKTDEKSKEDKSAKVNRIDMSQ